MYLFFLSVGYIFCVLQHKMTKQQIPRWEQMSLISAISNFTLLIKIRHLSLLLYLKNLFSNIFEITYGVILLDR